MINSMTYSIVSTVKFYLTNLTTVITVITVITVACNINFQIRITAHLLYEIYYYCHFDLKRVKSV